MQHFFLSSLVELLYFPTILQVSETSSFARLIYVLRNSRLAYFFQWWFLVMYPFFGLQ